MPTSYIYKIVNKISGKIYVGKSKNPASRFVRHIKIAETFSKTDNHFQAIHGAIKKYGKENFLLEIIEVCDEPVANDREIYWINELRTQIKDYGYNLTSGGDGVNHVSEESKAKRRAKMLGRKHSEEHKRKISQSNMGRIISLESRIKISQANSGKNNGMAGKTHSDDVKKKMSEFQSLRERRALTDEEKSKLSANLKGKPPSPRIPIEIKSEIVQLYALGEYTKQQLADKFGLKYNSIVKILRTNKKAY